MGQHREPKEAAPYRAVGGRPQVVWPNALLASTAIGVVMDLATGWTRQQDGGVHRSDDGKTGKMKAHVRLQHLPVGACPHYGDADLGDPGPSPCQAVGRRRP